MDRSGGNTCLATTHEETDKITVQQAMQVAVIGQKHVTILAVGMPSYFITICNKANLSSYWHSSYR